MWKNMIRYSSRDVAPLFFAHAAEGFLAQLGTSNFQRAELYQASHGGRTLVIAVAPLAAKSPSAKKLCSGRVILSMWGLNAAAQTRMVGEGGSRDPPGE